MGFTEVQNDLLASMEPSENTGKQAGTFNRSDDPTTETADFYSGFNGALMLQWFRLGAASFSHAQIHADDAYTMNSRATEKVS